MLGGVGEKSLRYILEYAQRIADRCLPPDGNAIQKMAGDITAMTNALCELRQEGKVSYSKKCKDFLQMCLKIVFII